MVGTSSDSSVRTRLACGAAFAGAGILTMGLVAVPPEPANAPADGRDMRLSAFVAPPARPMVSPSPRAIVAIPVSGPVPTPAEVLEVARAPLVVPTRTPGTVDAVRTASTTNSEVAQGIYDVLFLPGKAWLTLGSAVGATLPAPLQQFFYVFAVAAPVVAVYLPIATVFSLVTGVSSPVLPAALREPVVDEPDVTGAGLRADQPVSQLSADSESVVRKQDLDSSDPVRQESTPKALVERDSPPQDSTAPDAAPSDSAPSDSTPQDSTAPDATPKKAKKAPKTRERPSLLRPRTKAVDDSNEPTHVRDVTTPDDAAPKDGAPRDDESDGDTGGS